jgi:hypothetical protein
LKAEQEAAAKKAAEEEARLKAEQEALAKQSAEEEAKRKAEEEARLKAEQEAAAKKAAEEEARLKAEQEALAKQSAEEEAKRKAEEEARLKAEQEAAAKKAAEEEARLKAEQEAVAKIKAEQEELARKAAEEKEKRTKYEAIIVSAGEKEKNKQLKAALHLYHDALGLYPDESYPQQKVEELTEKLLAMEEENRLKEEERKREALLEEKMLEEMRLKQYTSVEFRSMVDKADLEFGFKKYQQSLTHYKMAQIMRPDDKHVNQMLDELYVILGIEKEQKEVKKETNNTESFKNELAQKYPEGVTEEKIEETNKIIIKRIVVRGNTGHEYKMVKHSYGGKFYFKDDHPITESVWSAETKK